MFGVRIHRLPSIGVRPRPSGVMCGERPSRTARVEATTTIMLPSVCQKEPRDTASGARAPGTVGGGATARTAGWYRARLSLRSGTIDIRHARAAARSARLATRLGIVKMRHYQSLVIVCAAWWVVDPSPPLRRHPSPEEGGENATTPPFAARTGPQLLPFAR
ncbi:MAG: hypothetical protein AVDCRST_MAG18-4317 [uncultured Thermomicrobiales bacterium]|uniref:Uncharacterized protein n=1 Tax=uncultured Thermomicrobiales bacterium TaxID=1645740 RepID=A0A6J4VSS5_9BACT|nr:MAG: hypothetical protein AVDCRST_MAG18-4317 [uncultured Thermomicrobiales bacterium]